MRRSVACIIVALGVFLSQMVLAAHGIEHTFEPPETVCVECLALPGFAALPASAFVISKTAPGAAPLQLIQPKNPSMAKPTLFLVRAPPRLQSPD